MFAEFALPDFLVAWPVGIPIRVKVGRETPWLGFQLPMCCWFPLLLRQRSVSGIGSSEETRLQFLEDIPICPEF